MVETREAVCSRTLFRKVRLLWLAECLLMGLFDVSVSLTIGD